MNHKPLTINHEGSTIVALSSPSGRAGRSIVRLSGPCTLQIADQLFTPEDGRTAGSAPTFSCLDGLVLDRQLPCRLYIMRGPRSYTREDVVEFHLPGNPLIAELVMEAAIDSGARLAEPGEFTRRAVESGRISPDQAEAVIRIIRARSRAELSAATRQLTGHAGRELSAWRERAEDLAADLEAELDYGEMPGSFAGEQEVLARLRALVEELEALITATEHRAETVRSADRLHIALAGPANAGKSLLFRQLTGREVLVSDQRGTTRDVIEFPLEAAPEDLALMDTAGLGAAPGEIELLARQASERAWRAADMILLVIDRSAELVSAELLPAVEAARHGEIPIGLVLNKSDLPAGTSLEAVEELVADLDLLVKCEVSALTGGGCGQLARELGDLVSGGRLERSAAHSVTGVRRYEVMNRARAGIRRGIDALESGLGLACAADDLREAAREVACHFQPGAGGSELDESILNRIFARFCVGK